MKLSTYIIITLIGFLFGIITIRVALTPHVDARTKEICRDLGGQLQKESKGTEYEELDFYQMCVDNIRYTSPLKR